MKLRSAHRYALLVALLAVALSAPSVSATQHSRPLFFFGDSLSDSGSYFLLFREVSTRPFDPVPSAPYAIGGLHFSNGATWAEQLSVKLHTPRSGLPALLAARVFTNYAVGRARARPLAPVFPVHDLGTQVGRFRGDFKGAAPADATYVVWIGFNDLSDALNALPVDPTGATSQAILQAALTSVATNIQTLWQSGARTFLVPNLPDAGLTPAVRAAGPAAQAAGTFFTGTYNAALSEALDTLSGLPGIHIVRLDVDALLAAVVANPASLGLTNVDDSCLTFGVVQHPFCHAPNQYLFWDGVHPTRAGHAILAGAAAEALIAD